MKSPPKVTILYEPMSPAEMLRLDRKRWRRHRVSTLAEGVSIVVEVPLASIYFRADDFVIEVEGEYSGVDRYDIILNSQGLDRQIHVTKLEPEPAQAELARVAMVAIEAWLNAKRWRFKYHPEIPPLASP